MSTPAFSPETLALVETMKRRYPADRQKSALIPVLHLAQAEFDGWLSVPVMDYVASLLHLQPIEVYEVASFYSMFNLKPVGKCVLEVCRTSSCWLCGAEDIIDHLEHKLGIQVGETTPDGMFTLKAVECLGSCGQVGRVEKPRVAATLMDCAPGSRARSATCGVQGAQADNRPLGSTLARQRQSQRDWSWQRQPSRHRRRRVQ
jgi:NADH-quinone oxidoreductase subunit E